MKSRDIIMRIGVPAVVFISVWGFHYLWRGVFPERDQTQSQWVQISIGDSPWWDRYVSTQSYWLGFSYALSLTFAVHALQHYQRDRYCAGRELAVGGVTLTGFLAVAGCFLIGCCGSPMLAVYLNVFGAAFVPLAKPVVALITSTTIAAAWVYLHSRRPIGAQSLDPCKCVANEDNLTCSQLHEAVSIPLREG